MQTVRLSAFLTFLVIISVSYGDPGDDGMPAEEIPKLPENATMEEKYLAVEKGMSDLINGMIKRALPKLIAQGNEADLSAECMGAFFKLISKARALDEQVFRMIDASAKLAPGIMDGSLTEFGNYWECLRITVRDDYSEEEQFRGQYCMVRGRPPLPPKPRLVTKHFSPVNESLFSKKSVMNHVIRTAGNFYSTQTRMGICMPSVCSRVDIEKIIKPLFAGLHWNASVPFCRVREDGPRLTNEDLWVIGILTLLAMPVIMATLFHLGIFFYKYFTNRTLFLPPVAHRVLTLSAYETARKIMVVHPPKDDDTKNLQVFHGLRACTIAWVVWVHHFAYNDIAVYSSASISEEIVGYYRNQIFNNGWLAVDTFFFISGFFLAYGIGRQKNAIGFGKVVLFFLLRWWRLIPMACVGICVLIITRRIGDGPIWNEFMDPEVNKCRTNWWLLMLNLQNWLDHDALCLVPYWYISVDTQLYCIFVGITILLFKRPKVAAFLMTALTGVGIAIIAAQNVVNNYQPTALFVAGDLLFSKEILTTTYLRPYTHFGPFCVGIAMAYIYLKHRHFKLSKSFEIGGWCGMAFCCGIALYATKDWGNGNVPSQTISALYASCHRTLWSLGVAWMIFACTTGRGGIVNQIMSYPGLIPVSRMSYVIYLLHVPVVWYRLWTIDERTHITFVPQFYNGVGSFIISLFVAFLGTIFFERPLMFIKDLVFPDPKRDSSGGATSQTSKVSPPHKKRRQPHTVIQTCMMTELPHQAQTFASSSVKL